MKRDELTPSLFDDPPVVEDVADDADADTDEWVEVGQAHFLSWSRAMQLHYCWRRDLDSAVHALSNDDAAFYLQRAASYKTALDIAITTP